MASKTDSLISQYYPSDRHPYRILEGVAAQYLGPEAVLLDAGCGHSAPLLSKFAPYVKRAIGIDVGPWHPVGVEYIQADLANSGLPDQSVDLVVSRSVLEHLQTPGVVFHELHRILKPGGRFIFLTPNRWDYASLMALAIPNSLHPKLVWRLTGRAERDTFPTFYRANSRRALQRLADGAGFQVDSIRYLNQYPDYFRKLPPLFLVGVAYERLTSRWDSLRYLRGWILGNFIRQAL